MIDYNSARYNFIMFYSTDDISVYTFAIDALSDIVKINFKDEIIKYKGFVNPTYFKSKPFRQSVFNSEKLKKSIIETHNQDASSIRLYLFDKGFSKEVPPRVFFNALWVKEDFNKFKLTSEGRELKSFYLFALRTDVKANIDFNSLFDQFNGVYGYYFESIQYAYDGESYLEWLFNNIPIRIKSGDISRWIEPKSVYNLYS